MTQMTPEEHYRRMMSALNEHGTFEEQQQQRLYQLANSMAVPSHGGTGSYKWGEKGVILPFGINLVRCPEPLRACEEDLWAAVLHVCHVMNTGGAKECPTDRFSHHLCGVIYPQPSINVNTFCRYLWGLQIGLLQ